MADTATPPERPQLSPGQLGRLHLAEASLDAARRAELADLPPASLVTLVERLRSSLHDTLGLLHELTGA